MAIPPVGNKAVTNTANGSFSDAVKGDTSTTKASTGGAVESASSDGSIKPGGSDFAGTDKLKLNEDLFE